MLQADGGEGEELVVREKEGGGAGYGIHEGCGEESQGEGAGECAGGGDAEGIGYECVFDEEDTGGTGGAD